MKTAEVLDLFEKPLEENWSPRNIVVRYHGGVAVVTEESFDYRDSNPKIETSNIGYNTQNGTYFFRCEESNTRDLFTFMVVVYQDGHKETEKARKRAKDCLQNPLFLGRVMAL